MRVVVQGRLKQRSYETREGEKRTVFELDVEEVGPTLKYATAKVTRTTARAVAAAALRGGGGGGGQAAAAASRSGGDPCGSPATRVAGGRRLRRPRVAASRLRPTTRGRARAGGRRAPLLIRTPEHHIHLTIPAPEPPPGF